MGSYKDAGVDIKMGDSLSRKFGEMAIDTLYVPGAELHAIDGFGGAFRLPTGYQKPVLISGTDGVGTKILLARDCPKGICQASLGQDLVAMCVNDILTSGAEPIYFLDYMAAHNLKLSKNVLLQVMSGIVKACRDSGCALIGGETAEMRLIYKEGDFDLAGFATGIVEEDEMLDPHRYIEPGMPLIGIASSGVHSNGFSLINEIVDKQIFRGELLLDKDLIGDRTVRQTLCAPTELYVKPVALSYYHDLKPVGMAHITGGGLPGNIPRILPEGCGVDLNWKWMYQYDRFRIFRWISKWGFVAPDDMFETFNMGIGYVMVMPTKEMANALVNILVDAGHQSWHIGEVVERADGPRVRMVAS